MKERDVQPRERTCPRCQGHGFTWDYGGDDTFYSLCTVCSGDGVIREDRTPADRADHGDPDGTGKKATEG